MRRVEIGVGRVVHKWTCVLALAGWMAGTSAAAQDLATLNGVQIRDLVVTGDLIPPAVLEQKLLGYRGRMVSAEELLQLARSLTEYLVSQGYVNSGVVLPDQKVESGIVRLETIPGRLDRIEVTGRKSLAARRVAARLEDLDAGAFNIHRAVERLQLLEREPLVRRINAELKPGIERGQALLNIDIEERRPYGVSVGIDNAISPNVGSPQMLLDAYHRSVLGLQDAFTLTYRSAEGFSGGAAEYRVPLSTHVAVGIRYAQDESRIVTEPFESLDIRGESQRYGAAVRATLIDGLTTQFALELGAQKDQVRSFLLGEPFSFSSADTAGRTTLAIAQFVQEWVRRGTDRVFAVRSTVNVGLDVWDASIGGNADGEFIEWVAQGEWLEKVDWRDGTVGLRLQVHLADDELPAFRKTSFGGTHSVRGYRESVVTRDNGATVSLEWKSVVTRWPLHWLNFSAGGDDVGQLSLAPFIDYGRGWNEFEDRVAAVELASAGLAVRWLPANNTSAELHYAKALLDYDSGALESVVADDGIHFSVRVGF